MEVSSVTPCKPCYAKARRCREGRFARDYPEVVLDITTDDSRVDLVAAGFDAGIQFGEFTQQDITAVRVSPDHRPAIVGSPDYFQLRRSRTCANQIRHERAARRRDGASS